MPRASEEAQPSVTETRGGGVLMSQCQAPSAPEACQAARGCSWRRAAKTGAPHSDSHPSSVTRDNVVLRADEHVGGPRHTITHSRSAEADSSETGHHRVPSKVPGWTSRVHSTARGSTELLTCDCTFCFGTMAVVLSTLFFCHVRLSRHYLPSVAEVQV